RRGRSRGGQHGRLLGGMCATAAPHQRVTLIPSSREQVGGEVEDGTVVVLEAPQHVDERLLGGVRRVVRRARQAQAVVVDLFRAAVVKRRIRLPAAGCGFSNQHTVWGGCGAAGYRERFHETSSRRYAPFAHRSNRDSNRREKTGTAPGSNCEPAHSWSS